MEKSSDDLGFSQRILLFRHTQLGDYPGSLTSDPVRSAGSRIHHSSPSPSRAPPPASLEPAVTHVSRKPGSKQGVRGQHELQVSGAADLRRIHRPCTWCVSGWYLAPHQSKYPPRFHEPPIHSRENGKTSELGKRRTARSSKGLELSPQVHWWCPQASLLRREERSGTKNWAATCKRLRAEAGRVLSRGNPIPSFYLHLSLEQIKSC